MVYTRGWRLLDGYLLKPDIGKLIRAFVQYPPISLRHPLVPTWVSLSGCPTQGCLRDSAHHRMYTLLVG